MSLVTIPQIVQVACANLGVDDVAQQADVTMQLSVTGVNMDDVNAVKQAAAKYCNEKGYGVTQVASFGSTEEVSTPSGSLPTRVEAPKGIDEYLVTDGG